MNRFDVLVVGGGPAGMLAAASAAKQGVSVGLLEKGQQLGRKMLITGGGRCNLTNMGELDHFIKNIPGNGKFMYSAFNTFFNKDLLVLMENLGVKTKIEEKGKVYPVSDRAQTVVEALEKYLYISGVKLFVNSPVKRLVLEQNKCLGLELENGKKFFAISTIIATGGASFPHTGSSGDGYQIAEEAGHSIIELFPAAVALVCNNSYIINKKVQGLSLHEVAINLYNAKGKLLTVETGDVVFTHFGLSGPAALRVSRYVSLSQKKMGPDSLEGKIDLWPRKDLEQIQKEIQEILYLNSRKSLKNTLKDYLPDRLAVLCLEVLKLSEEIQSSQVSKTQIMSIAQFVKSIPITVIGTRPLQEATVTGGGIRVKEIDPKTFASKLVEGLYFAGEIIDVDAHTGGYNMQCAFSMGYAAGIAGAQAVKEKEI